MNKKLYRSVKDRKLAGVCGGAGEFFSIDPTIIRVLFVICAFFPGFIFGGVLVYIALALIVPQDPGYTDI
ncbi:MAG: PspC domain-containing protein [Firmicutes bacterium]|nr:PspC domain-containing protein [Bacillota bacterium]